MTSRLAPPGTGFFGARFILQHARLRRTSVARLHDTTRSEFGSTQKPGGLHESSLRLTATHSTLVPEFASHWTECYAVVMIVGVSLYFWISLSCVIKRAADAGTTNTRQQRDLDTMAGI